MDHRTKSFDIYSIQDVRLGQRMKLIISGRPRAQQRPRVALFRRKGRREKQLIYSPSQKLQNELRDILRSIIHPRVEGIGGARKGNKKHSLCLFEELSPLKAEIKFFIPRPKSHFKKNCVRSISNLVPHATSKKHVSKPDVDNMVKLVLDAMQGVVYRNDSHIDTVIATKAYDNVGPCTGRISIDVSISPKARNDNENEEENDVIVIE
jgi:Holliday junction resolvase